MLRTPVVVVRGGAVVFANQPFLALLALTQEEAVGAEVMELIGRFVVPEQTADVVRRYEEIGAGAAPVGETWVELRTARGLATVCVRTSPTPRPDEWVFAVQDTPGMADARRLTEALARATPALLASSTEDEVLERALDVISAQGFASATLFVEGEWLRHGPLRQDPAAIAEGERIFGRKIQEVRFARSRLPHVDRAFETRSAAYHPDIFMVIEAIHPPELVAWMRARLPPVPILDSPVFVEDRPFGLISVMGPRLSPMAAASLELFAQFVGSALEAVRERARSDERLRELQRLQRELIARERLAAVGAASAQVSHEACNPVGAILNAAAVLRHERGLSGDGAQVVSIIAEEAHRLDGLVNDLLDFARPIEAEARRTDLRRLASEVLEAAAPAAVASGVTLELSAGPPVEVDADAELLRLAIRNLVRDAIQVSPRKGRVRVTPAGGLQAAVSVEDQGPAVAAADLPRIFEPFFALRARGSGLGLAVVRRVAEVHRAQVEVEQSELGGARFTLRLPPPTP